MDDADAEMLDASKDVTGEDVPGDGVFDDGNTNADYDMLQDAPTTGGKVNEVTGENDTADQAIQEMEKELVRGLDGEREEDPGMEIGTGGGKEDDLDVEGKILEIVTGPTEAADDAVAPSAAVVAVEETVANDGKKADEEEKVGQGQEGTIEKDAGSAGVEAPTTTAASTDVAAEIASLMEIEDTKTDKGATAAPNDGKEGAEDSMDIEQLLRGADATALLQGHAELVQGTRETVDGKNNGPEKASEATAPKAEEPEALLETEEMAEKVGDMLVDAVGGDGKLEADGATAGAEAPEKEAVGDPNISAKLFGEGGLMEEKDVEEKKTDPGALLAAALGKADGEGDKIVTAAKMEENMDDATGEEALGRSQTDGVSEAARPTEPLPSAAGAEGAKADGDAELEDASILPGAATDMQTSPELIELERALEQAAETLNQIALSVTNFTLDHQTSLFENMNQLARELKELDAKSQTLNTNVPFRVLEAIDRGKNPLIVTQQLLESTEEANNIALGKLDVMNSFREALDKSISGSRLSQG